MSEPSPFVAEPVLAIAGIPITAPVITTWAIMLAMTLAAVLLTRRLEIHPGLRQTAVEVVVTGIADQIEATMQRPAAPFLPFLGTLFLFLVVANVSLVLPGVEAPTARIETTAALAILVFLAGHVYGIRSRGVRGYLAHYLKPNPLLLPLNVLGELTRTFSLAVRLFGNIMSHAVIMGLLIAFVGLLVPVPFMALGILIGLIQAYIFTVLATVYIGAAVGAFEAH